MFSLKPGGPGTASNISDLPSGTRDGLRHVPFDAVRTEDSFQHSILSLVGLEGREQPSAPISVLPPGGGGRSLRHVLDDVGKTGDCLDHVLFDVLRDGDSLQQTFSLCWGGGGGWQGQFPACPL